MKILVDMNLSPKWCEVFERNNLESEHWSKVGDYKAKDTEIMQWASVSSYCVFTNDLDFGTLLALTKAEGPSVIQIRTQDVSPEYLGRLVIATLRQYRVELEKGALIIVDEDKQRVRLLPLSE